MGRKKRSRSIVREFDAYFGTGTLEDWQRLCRDVGLTKTYTSIKQCRQALHTVHVNIYDLLDAVKRGQIPHRFGSRAELASYTVSTKKIYPKNRAKEMGPVRALLRIIL